MTDLLLRPAALLSIVWIATATIHRFGGSAAMRHMAWLFGFAGLALLPLLSAILPALPLPILPSDNAPLVGPALIQPTGTAVAGGDESGTGLWTLIYLGVVFGLLARLVAGRMFLSRTWKSARTVDNDAHKRLLESISASFSLRRKVTVRIGTAPTVPMTWGLFRPRILLPVDAHCWSDQQWRIVLLHEFGHIARHDSAGSLAAAILCAFYWPNPVAWLAAEKMRREQEHACDDLVLAHGAEAHLYARNLLDAARTLQTPVPALSFATAIIRSSDLERRLIAIIGDVSRRRAGGAFGTAAALLALCFATLAAAIVPVAATIPAEPRSAPTLTRAKTTAPASKPAPGATEIAYARATTPVRISRNSIPAAAPAAALIEAIAPVESAPDHEYKQALGRYHQQRAEYRVALYEYRARLTDYHREVAQYRQDLADHRRRIEAVRALPEGSPDKIVPPAPVAPVAPVAPTAPVVPPLPPPDLNHS